MMFPHSQVPRTRHEHIFWGTSFHPPFRRQLPPPPFTLCITVHYTVPPCFNYPLSNSQCLIQATYTCLPVLNISQGSLEKQTSKILAYKEIYFVRNWLMQLWRLTSPIKEANKDYKESWTPKNWWFWVVVLGEGSRVSLGQQGDQTTPS